MSLNFDELKGAGVEIRKFCGIPDRREDGTIETDGVEAVGELIAELEDGTSIPVPVCQRHLNLIMNGYDVEELDSDGAHLLD